MNVRATAIILAAGRGERMGREKALLEFGAESALTRMIRNLRGAGVERIVVVLREIRPELRRKVDLEGVTTALNATSGSGATRSLRIGLANLRSDCDAFLICPVDQPLFESSDVRALLVAFEKRSASISIIAPSDGSRRGHPVVFARGLASEFQSLGDDVPPHTVIRKDPNRVHHVPLSNPELYIDLDTPEDHAAAVTRMTKNG